MICFIFTAKLSSYTLCFHLSINQLPHSTNTDSSRLFAVKTTVCLHMRHVSTTNLPFKTNNSIKIIQQLSLHQEAHTVHIEHDCQAVYHAILKQEFLQKEAPWNMETTRQTCGLASPHPQQQVNLVSVAHSPKPSEDSCS